METMKNTKDGGLGAATHNSPVTQDISPDELAMFENMAREREDMLYGYQTLIEDTLHHFMSACPA